MTIKGNIPKLIPNAINSVSGKKFNKSVSLLHSLHHFSCETGVTKKRRADNFLNIQKVLLVLLPQVELSTLSVGNFYRRHDGKVDFYNQGVDWIVEKSNVSKKTVSRVLSVLVDRGYMKVKHCSGINTQGEEIRYNSIRTFTNKFFIECGMQNQTIEAAKNRKKKKLSKKFSGMNLSSKCKEGIGKVSEAFKIAVNKVTNKRKAYKTIPTVKQSINPTDTKNLLHKASLTADKTGRSPMEVYRQLTSKQ